jgi:carbamoyltransferase
MVVLGLNIGHGDSSACLIANGRLLSAVEEERFSRVKHCSEFPLNSIDFCLKSNNLDIQDVDYISVNYNYKYNNERL